MIQWQLNPELEEGPVRDAFSTLTGTFSLQGEPIAKDPLSTVVRITLGGKRYYVKRYVGNGKNRVQRWFGLRGYVAPQRVVNEWRNLQRFREWGIPTAKLVAWGLERRHGYFIRGALITEELPNSMDMGTMVNTRDERLKHSAWIREVTRQVATYTRLMHKNGFAHNDLKWRNLLVNDQDVPTVYLIDCPTGSFWWGPFLQYRIIKDLACLDKIGKLQLSRTQRLRFYLEYVQKPRLQESDKRMVLRILRFFEGRE